MLGGITHLLDILATFELLMGSMCIISSTSNQLLARLMERGREKDTMREFSVPDLEQ